MAIKIPGAGGGLTTATADATYLALDASNGPITSDLDVTGELSSRGYAATQTLGAEVLTQTAAGWGLSSPVGAWSAAGDTITRTASGSDLTITNSAAVVGTTYKVVIVTATVTAGNVTASFGGATGTAISTATTTTAYFTATATTAFTLTASAAFAGTITISTTSVKAITSDITTDVGPLVVTSPGSIRLAPASGFGSLFTGGSVTAPGIGWVEDSDGTATGAYRPAANQWGLTVNGVKASVLGVSGTSHIWYSSAGSARISLVYDSNTPTLTLTQSTAATMASTPVAQTYTTANGAQWVASQISELITLSTSGTTTDSTADLLPANSIIESVVCRVTTTISTATDWSVGDASTAARFASANATMTAGSTSIGLNHQKGGVSTDATGQTQAAAAKLRITTTGTPGAGAVRCTVFYRQFVAPTS